MNELFQKAFLANKVSKQYFVNCLNNNSQVHTYVEKRIGKNTIDKWEIGFNPGDGGLINILNKNGIDTELAETIGLIKTNEEGKSREAFPRRILFPIRYAGKTIAFAGRILDSTKNQAKYINSKASFIYNKNDVLFGLGENRNAIKDKGYIIIVEGYFDILALYSRNIKNVACLGGITLSSRHATCIKRYTDKAVIMTDGDTAGEESAIELKKRLAVAGISSYYKKLPAGKDPDTYIETLSDPEKEFDTYLDHL
jgi:DNA primase